MRTANDPEDLFLSVWSLMLGAALIAAPWYLGYTAEPTPCWSAWASGAAVAFLSLAALIRVHDWLEYLTAALGLWLCAAPWALEFEAIVAPAWSHVGFGLSLIIAAGCELWRLREARAARTV